MDLFSFYIGIYIHNINTRKCLSFVSFSSRFKTFRKRKSVMKKVILVKASLIIYLEKESVYSKKKSLTQHLGFFRINHFTYYDY